MLVDPNRFERCIKNDSTLQILAKHYPNIFILQKTSITEVLKTIRQSFAEIRNAGRLLALSRKDKDHPFTSFPRELVIEIAAKTADSEVHEKEAARKMAEEYIPRL